MLDIDRIEMNHDGTKVFFYFIYYPNYWISIPKDAYLMDSKGTKYHIVDSGGIELGGHLYGDDNGQGVFSITFKPIPEDVETIDFRESSSDDSWSIKGIVLKPII